MGKVRKGATFSEADIRMIREYRHGGWKFEELRVLFPGVTDAKLSDICRGRTYKNAGGPITEPYQHCKSRQAKSGE